MIEKLILSAGGTLIIQDELLAAEIAPENVAGLNRKLIALGVEERHAVILGVPEKISTPPGGYIRERLWQRIYGDLKIPELF